MEIKEGVLFFFLSQTLGNLNLLYLNSVQNASSMPMVETRGKTLIKNILEETKTIFKHI